MIDFLNFVFFALSLGAIPALVWYGGDIVEAACDRILRWLRRP